MNYLRAIVMVLMMTMIGCANTSKMNRLSVGMAKSEAIAVMGQPTSTAAHGGGIELLRYRLASTDSEAWQAMGEEYFVRIVDGKVDSYGKMGDFNSTKDPTINVNVK